MSEIQGDDQIWLALAELFFLDIQPEDHDYVSAARLIKQMGWNRHRTELVLVELIAPVAGHNLGFLLYPVIGAWQGFDREDLRQKIQKRIRARERHPRWLILLQDWHSRRMLKSLEVYRLLDLL